MKKLILYIVVTVVAIGVGLGAAAAWSVWYRSTGHREQFQAAPKPQKANYNATPANTIMTTGKEPDVDTRFVGQSLRNPVSATSESIANGKQLYLIYCAPCHGESGDGMGLMGAVPYLSRAPESEDKALAKYMSGYLGYEPGVNSSFVLDEPDGEIYYTITKGGEAIMPGFTDALNPTERWDLINYIKKGLGSGIE